MTWRILALRWTAVRHSLRRDWWRLLVLIGGAVWSVSLVPAVWWASRIISFNAIDLKADALMLIFTALTVGWVMVPLLITGLDDTVDPGRFAVLGVSARRLQPGLTAVAFTTLPALFFLAASVMLAASWHTEGWQVLSVALAGAVLSVAMMVLSARVAVSWAARLLQLRRSRLVATAAIVAGIALLAPVAVLLFRDGLEIVLEYDLRVLLTELARIPVGAPISAAEEAARGRWENAWWRLATAAAWVVVLYVAWGQSIAHRLVHPQFRGGGARSRADGVLAAAAKARPGVDIPTRSVYARLSRYWSSDPRYLAAAASAAAFPALLLVIGFPIVGDSALLVAAVPLVLAGTIGWGRHNDVAFDSTAAWLDIVSGRRGTAVMRGRMLAVLAWAGPLCAAAVVVAVAVSGRYALLPAMVGATAGLLGASLGASALSAVALPYRAPAPGENPFTAEVGSVGAGLVAQLTSSVTAWALAVPVTLPLIAAILWDVRWGWLGLALGIAAGGGGFIAGTRWAGRIYDNRSGRLLGAIS